MPDAQRRFRQPRIDQPQRLPFHSHAPKRVIWGALIAAFALMVFCPVSIAASMVVPGDPQTAIDLAQATRTGVFFAAVLSSTFFMTLPNWHWAERWIIGPLAFLGAFIPTAALALEPVTYHQFDVSFEWLPLCPVTVWGVATPLAAANLWGGLRVPTPDRAWQTPRPKATLQGMIAYTTATAAIVGSLSVHSVGQIEGLVLFVLVALGAGALAAFVTGLLWYAPHRWVVAFFAVAGLLLASGVSVGLLGADGYKAMTGEATMLATTAIVYGLFVVTFRSGGPMDEAKPWADETDARP